MNTTETIHDSKGKIFCKSGGCGAKLGAGLLSHILERLPAQKPKDKLLVGFDSHDDAAVYQIDDTRLIVGGDNTVCIVNIKNCKIETLLI